MRKLLALAAVVALATPAYAGIGIDTRYDYSSGQSNSQASSTTDYLSGFGFSRLFITADGKVTDGVTVKAALNPLAFAPGNASVTDTQAGNTTKTITASNGLTIVNPVATGALVSGAYPVTGPNDFVQWAQADIKVSDMLTLNAGKLGDLGLGGFEGQNNPGDEYFLSQGDLATAYLTGAQVQYQINDGQKVAVVFANNNSTTDTTRSALGAWYAGMFGNFGVRASYHSLPVTQVTAGAQTLTPLTVGLMYKMDDWKFTLDYDNLTTTNASLAGNSKILSTVVLEAKYNMGNWNPWLKVESTSRQGYETAGTKDVNDSVLNWSLAAEYKKNAADPFRYEVAYVSSTTNFGGNAFYNGQTNATVNASAFYFGVRYLGDFLK